MPDRHARLDGNAVAGILAEAFGGEMTDERIGCPSCRSVWAVGQCHAYPGGPGAVVRCCGCDAILLVIARRRTMSCVEVHGSFRR